MENPWREPRLRYVPLPVDASKGICDDNYGKRCPEAYHNIFVTLSAVKFVSINKHYSSCCKVALDRCWSTFRISTLSLGNYSDNTWIEEATLDAEEFWGLDAENQLPRVVPKFPVFNMKNLDAICFSLNEGSHTFGYSGKTWMVEVHIVTIRIGTVGFRVVVRSRLRPATHTASHIRVHGSSPIHASGAQPDLRPKM